MESRAYDMQNNLRGRLLDAHGRGIQYSAVDKATGISRTKISQFANGHYNLKPAEKEVIGEYLDRVLSDGEDATEPETVVPFSAIYKTETELYQTAEYREAIGWCRYILNKRRAGVMIGYPGSGKTTILKEFCRITPGAHFIDCWPTMIIGDLIKTIAASLGLTVTGTKHERVMQIVNALRNRTDVMLIFDEAENLKNWNVKCFEILRKIWDHTSTPVIFCGTQELENMLTRGGGRDNLAQLYRRKYEFKLTGITSEEVTAILRDYHITPDAANILLKIALDVKHGGMGNFVELLDMALETSAGGVIDAGIVDGAKQYKLLY